MKKLAIAMTMLAMMVGNVAQAATKTGSAAQGGVNAGTDGGFAWGPAVAGLAVVGVVVGVTAAAASSSSNSNSFGH